MGDLKLWAKKHGKIIIIQPNETVTVTYKGFKEGMDSFGDTIFYQLQLEGEDTVKVWNNRNMGVANQMADVVEGQVIEISRSVKGDDGKTKYTITPSTKTE